MIKPVQLHTRVNELVKKHGSLIKASKAIKVSTPYLSRIRDGQHPTPSQSTLNKMGLKVVFARTRA